MDDAKLMEWLGRLVAAHAEQRRQAECSLLKWGTPGPCWRVEHAHSYIEQKVYDMLKRIGQCEDDVPQPCGYLHARSRAVSGIKVGPPDSSEWHAFASRGVLADLLGMHPSTLHRTLLSLECKHSIASLQVRNRGHQRTYHVRTDDEVLRLRREDPTIGTTRCQVDPALSLQWHNGRDNSRRLLTPAEVELWELCDLKSIIWRRQT